MVTGTSATGIGNLSTLLKRLEAATSRLEDITLAQSQAASGTGAAGAGAATPIARGVAMGGAGAPPPPPPPPPSAAPAQLEDPPAVEAWDETVVPALNKYEELSATIGGLVQEQAKHVTTAFEAQRHLILLAASCAKPPGGSPTTGPSPAFVELLGPIQKALMAAGEVRDSNRAEKKLFNHLATVAEGLPACGWVAVDAKPAPFVESMKDSAQFYSNRVLKEYKDAPTREHVEWTRAFIALITELTAYVKQHHTTGLTWNPKGGDATKFSAGSSPAPAASGGAPPPPPPPAPAAAAASSGGGMDALFSQLNQGEGITSGLKKVDRSQMTHKNPELRSQAPVVAAAKGGPPRPAAKPSALKAKKPPKTELEGNKWAVEYHEDNREILIDNTELNQIVAIFGCKNCTIQVRGKVNAVSMVGCTKTSLLIDTLVSSLEITSSPSFAVQVTGRTPTILLDSCDSGQIYLSAAGLDVDLVTSKCSAINVSVPDTSAKAEEGEMKEFALPEQMTHKFAEGKFKTEVMAHSG